MIFDLREVDDVTLDELFNVLLSKRNLHHGKNIRQHAKATDLIQLLKFVDLRNRCVTLYEKGIDLTAVISFPVRFTATVRQPFPVQVIYTQLSVNQKRRFRAIDQPIPNQTPRESFKTSCQPSFYSRT
jgi:hypothetical protein